MLGLTPGEGRKSIEGFERRTWVLLWRGPVNTVGDLHEKRGQGLPLVAPFLHTVSVCDLCIYCHPLMQSYASLLTISSTRNGLVGSCSPRAFNLFIWPYKADVNPARCAVLLFGRLPPGKGLWRGENTILPSWQQSPVSCKLEAVVMVLYLVPWPVSGVTLPWDT